MSAFPVNAAATRALPEFIKPVTGLRREPVRDVRFCHTRHRRIADEASTQGLNLLEQVKSEDDLGGLPDGNPGSNEITPGDGVSPQKVLVAGEQGPPFAPHEADEIVI